MEKRIRKLEDAVGELAAAVARLEVELGILRGRSGDSAAPAAATPAPALPTPLDALETTSSFGQLLGLLGRTFLVLGGAFLIRAITDSGTLPRAVGVALGLGFGLAWCVAADRALARGRTLSAGFHAGAAAIIGYPLVWETSTRFDVLSPPLAALALTLFTLALFAVARRHDSVGVAWLGAGASVCTGLALVFATDALGALLFALLALLGGALWLEDARGWGGPRWPVVLAADFVLLRLGNGFFLDKPPDVHPGTAMALALALPGVLLVGHGRRSFARDRDAGVFELVNLPLSLLVGLGSAVHITSARGGSALPFAVAALLLAASGYLLGFTVLEARTAQPRDRELIPALATGLTLGAGELLGSPIACALWCALGLAAAALANRRARLGLLVQGAVFLWAAAIRSGLTSLAIDGLAGSPEQPLASLSMPAALALVSAAAGAALVFRLREPGTWIRAIRGGYALLLALGVAGLAAAGAAALMAPMDRGMLAVLRTAVLAITALAAAGLRRFNGFRELGWLAFGMLGAGALQLLFDAMPNGRAATLVMAFSLYGAALILTSRFAREQGAS